MQVSGVITNDQGTAIPNVRVDLAIDGIRFAVVYTDEAGRYSHSHTASYPGGVLSVRAEKSGYVDLDVTKPVVADLVTVDLAMARASAAPQWYRVAIVAGVVLAILAVGLIGWMSIRPSGDRTDPIADEATFRFVIEDVFSIAGRGTVIAGTMQSGAVRPGDSIRILSPDGNQVKHETVVTGISVREVVVRLAGAGDQVGLLVRDVPRGIGPGDVVIGLPRNPE